MLELLVLLVWMLGAAWGAWFVWLLRPPDKHFQIHIWTNEAAPVQCQPPPMTEGEEWRLGKPLDEEDL
jgi:hypothetical protein